MKKFILTIEFDSEFYLDYCEGQLTDGFGKGHLDLSFISKHKWHANFDAKFDEFYSHHIKYVKKYGSAKEKLMLKESGIDHEGIEFKKDPE